MMKEKPGTALAYSYRKAPRDPPGLTSLSDGRTVHIRYCPIIHRNSSFRKKLVFYNLSKIEPVSAACVAVTVPLRHS